MLNNSTRLIEGLYISFKMSVELKRALETFPNRASHLFGRNGALVWTSFYYHIGFFNFPFVCLFLESLAADVVVVVSFVLFHLRFDFFFAQFIQLFREWTFETSKVNACHSVNNTQLINKGKIKRKHSFCILENSSAWKKSSPKIYSATFVSVSLQISLHEKVRHQNEDVNNKCVTWDQLLHTVTKINYAW